MDIIVEPHDTKEFDVACTLNEELLGDWLMLSIEAQEMWNSSGELSNVPCDGSGEVTCLCVNCPYSVVDGV
jgi:hypothetical protein